MMMYSYHVAIDPKSNSLLGLRALRTGTYFGFAVITSLFMLFFLAMIMRSQLGDWQSLSEQPWQPLFEPTALWRNSGLLLFSSILLQLAYRGAVRAEGVLLRVGLLSSALMTLCFFAGQWQLWQQFIAFGFEVNSTPAASFFYLLTALHGAHLFLGLMLWGYLLPKLWQQPLEHQLHQLKLLVQYWHFLLLLFVVLSALLSSSSATYQALAALCGIQAN